MVIMVPMWIVVLLAQGSRAFLIHSPVYSRCLESSVEELTLQLKPCSLDSGLQQWLLTEDRLLVNQGTKRPLCSQPVGPVLASPCNLSAHHLWQHAKSMLTCNAGVLPLLSNGRDVMLSQRYKLSRWMFLTENDISKKLLSKRASGNRDDLLTEGIEEGRNLTEEQKEYLRWFYRTEDSSSWMYTILGLSFAAFLAGSVLLAWGITANRSRKAIASYKATPQGLMMKELRSWTRVRESQDGTLQNIQDMFTPTSEHRTAHDLIPMSEHKRMQVLKPGDILLRWKDGSVSIM